MALRGKPYTCEPHELINMDFCEEPDMEIINITMAHKNNTITKLENMIILLMKEINYLKTDLKQSRANECKCNKTT